MQALIKFVIEPFSCEFNCLIKACLFYYIDLIMNSAIWSLMCKIILLSFIFLSTFCYTAEAQNISLQDQERLEYFFKFLMTRGSFGYTLCGDKPCSIQTYPNFSKLPLIPSLKIIFKFPAYSLLSNGWHNWSKYSYSFQSKNFIFRYIKQSNTYVLINRKATRRIIEDNIDLFRKYSHLDWSIDDFLEEVCNPKENDYFTNANTALLGILLGYGRNNSLAFAYSKAVHSLKKFSLYEGPYTLNLIYDPGFMTIQNGTNNKENAQIKKNLNRLNEIL